MGQQCGSRVRHGDPPPPRLMDRESSRWEASVSCRPPYAARMLFSAQAFLKGGTQTPVCARALAVCNTKFLLPCPSPLTLLTGLSNIYLASCRLRGFDSNDREICSYRRLVPLCICFDLLHV